MTRDENDNDKPADFDVAEALDTEIEPVRETDAEHAFDGEMSTTESQDAIDNAGDGKG